MSLYKSLEDNLQLIFFFLGVAILVYFNNYKGDFTFGYAIPGVLLAFVGLFYPLFFVRGLEKSRNYILSSKWSELNSFITSETRKINNIMKTRKESKLDKARDSLSNISKKLEVFQDESTLLKVENHTLRSIVASIITIILTLFLIPSKEPIFIVGTDISLNMFMMGFLIASIYYVLKIVIAWHKIITVKV